MSEIRCNIIIDSCCDLPASVVDVPGVTVMQFPYLIDGVEHLDDMYASMSAHDYFESIRKGAEPSTAQIPINVFVETFTAAIESGIPTVYLSFTSGLSGSCGTAQLIRDQLWSTRSLHRSLRGSLCSRLFVNVRGASLLASLWNGLKKRASMSTSNSWLMTLVP